MLIDTHSHLFDKAFENDLNKCIENAKNNSIYKIILVGYDNSSNQKALELTKKYNIFYNSCGIHPSEAIEDYLVELEKLEIFIKNNKVIAIGECGLDYYWVKDNKQIQKDLFIKQIELSIKYNLPLIIHVRDAILDTYDILKEYRGKIRGVMHCYSGSLEMANEFIKLGFYISVAGPVTYKNAIEPKRIAKELDIDKLLIETDCPYLTPSPYRGQRNESSYVRIIAEEIAKLRNISLEELALKTTSNAKKLFDMQGE